MFWASEKKLNIVPAFRISHVGCFTCRGRSRSYRRACRRLGSLLIALRLNGPSQFVTPTPTGLAAASAPTYPVNGCGTAGLTPYLPSFFGLRWAELRPPPSPRSLSPLLRHARWRACGRPPAAPVAIPGGHRRPQSKLTESALRVHDDEADDVHCGTTTLLCRETRTRITYFRRGRREGGRGGSGGRRGGR